MLDLLSVIPVYLFIVKISYKSMTYYSNDIKGAKIGVNAIFSDVNKIF